MDTLITNGYHSKQSRRRTVDKMTEELIQRILDTYEFEEFLYVIAELEMFDELVPYLDILPPEMENDDVQDD